MGIKNYISTKLGLSHSQNFLNYENVNLSNNQKHIFIACMPKSGSTFLSNTLTEITQFKKVAFRLNPIDNIYEHEVYLPAVYLSKDVDTITQQHARGSKTNYSILSNLSAHILVQTRNIFDVVISTYDHSENSKKSGSSMAYANTEYFSLSEDLKLRMIIDLVVPWHIHFFVSWYDRMRKEEYSKMSWVSYEELVEDETAIISRILKFCETEKSREEIENSVMVIKESKTKARFNIGRVGRGDQLSEELKSRIVSFTEYYPWVDFSKLGITK